MIISYTYSLARPDPFLSISSGFLPFFDVSLTIQPYNQGEKPEVCKTASSVLMGTKPKGDLFHDCFSREHTIHL